jgi:hypothetical protein
VMRRRTRRPGLWWCSMACTLGPSPAGRGSREPGAGGGASVGRGRVELGARVLGT